MAPTTPPPMDAQLGAHDIEMSPMHQLLGGGLKANDPRQFLVEVMVGAVHADGHVDRREELALERILSEHALFSGLPAHALPALIELASDAFYFAGGVGARLDRIAAALPWRLHRLAAYGMAAELVAADDIVTDDEEAYLRSLRRALQIGDRESGELAVAARGQRGLSALDLLSERVAALRDRAIRIAVALQRTRGAFGRDQASLVERTFASMVDFENTPQLDAARIESMAVELPSDPGNASIELGSRITDPADRYWALTYALAVDAVRGTDRAWSDCATSVVLRLAFEMSVRAMDRCQAHAGRIAEYCRGR